MLELNLRYRDPEQVPGNSAFPRGAYSYTLACRISGQLFQQHNLLTRH